MTILSDKIVTTRKRQRCCACGRVFDAGAKMRTQVNTDDGIQVWRECETCNALMRDFPSMFEDCDHYFYSDCVSEVLASGQTPEMLLILLINEPN